MKYGEMTKNKTLLQKIDKVGCIITILWMPKETATRSWGEIVATVELSQMESL